ncbi:holo-ACP synthase [Thermophilibacter sp.]
MATAGVGVDMLEISRMERVLARSPRFAEKVFTDEERAYCDATARPAEHYAARWAAREAVVKALGTGFADGVGLRDVSVGRDEGGRPRAVLAGRVAELVAERGIREVALSISHTHDVAVANAILVTDDVRPAPDTRREAERALASSFKEARSILDELDRAQASELQGLGLATDETVTPAAGDGAEDPAARSKE